VSPSRRRRLTITLSTVAVAVAVGAGLALHASADEGTTGVAAASPTGTAAGTSSSAAAPASTAATTSRSAASTPRSAAPSVPVKVVESAGPTDVATDPAPTVAPSAGDAGIFLTYADYSADNREVEVNGYVDGIVEDDGTCTLTLTKGSSTATASGAGTGNVTNTSCGQLVVPRSRLSSGTWTAVVTYSSAKSHGSSEPARVVVP
jgi:hypothetical protein